MIEFSWPREPIPSDNDLTDFPIVNVEVTTPKDQAELHRHLALKGYCPVLLAERGGERTSPVQFWRFHHPDGEKP